MKASILASRHKGLGNTTEEIGKNVRESMLITAVF